MLVYYLIVNDVFSGFMVFDLLLLKSDGQEDVLGSWSFMSFLLVVLSLYSFYFFLGGGFLWSFICWQVLKLDAPYHSR